MTHTPEELQAYWDAALIKHWRKADRLHDAVNMWEAITQQRFADASLLRKPLPKYPWRISVRVFAAKFLPKISEWLWDNPPDKDVLLLKKLGVSKYDTLKKAITSDTDNDLSKLRKSTRKAHEKIKLDATRYSERNSATDWGTVNGSVRVRRK